MTDVVIIGASCAGHTVAAALRQKNKDLPIVLISESPFPPCDKRKLLEYFAGKRKEKELYLGPADLFTSQAVALAQEVRVMGLNPVRKTVQLKKDEKRESIPYDKLVICTGTHTELPDIPGIHKEGVFVFESLKDFKAAKAYVIADMVCLTGPWNERGRALAEFFCNQKKEVKYVHPEPPAAILPAGVEFIQSSIIEVIGEDGAQAIKLKEGKILATSLLIYTGPVVASTGFLKETPVKLDGQGFISLDEKLMSSCKDVYACGSVTGPAASSWDAAAAQASLVADIISAAIP